MRRVLSRNSDITRAVEEAYATREQFALLQTYLASRHPDGGMSDMDFIRYEMMVEECASATDVVEYRDAEDQLIACMLVDVIGDGLSLVYSFFDPALGSRSLGNFMILDQILRSKELGLPYAYLGYWVPGSPKMDYKARYKPNEVLGPDGWRHIPETP